VYQLVEYKTIWDSGNGTFASPFLVFAPRPTNFSIFLSSIPKTNGSSSIMLETNFGEVAMIPINVLVVDDSRTMRIMVMRAINNMPGITWNISEASDGLEAIQVIQNQPTELILLDWNMPNCSGIDLVRAIRQMGWDLPIVMITSEKTVAKIEEALNDAGANGYICKPFTENEVHSKIGSVLKDYMEKHGKGHLVASL
jgi:two-component system, chemotaxis family, chemotaxis protein CheY